MYKFIYPLLVLLISICVRFSHSRLFEWIVLYLILFQSFWLLGSLYCLLRTMPPTGRKSKAPVKGSSSRTLKGARDENLPINPAV